MRLERADVLNPMSTSRYHELCMYLDRERRWKLLTRFIGDASRLDFDKYHCSSSVLLGVIFSQVHAGETPLMTLERLQKMLGECNLAKAAEIVHEDIQQMRRNHSWSGSRTNDMLTFSLHAPTQCTDGEHSYSDEAKLHRTPPMSVQEPDNVYEEIAIPRVSNDSVGGADAWTHLPDRQPEENDEAPDQIHTLQSAQSLQRFVGQNNVVQPRRRTPEPTEQEWPSQEGSDTCLPYDTFHIPNCTENPEHGDEHLEHLCYQNMPHRPKHSVQVPKSKLTYVRFKRHLP